MIELNISVFGVQAVMWILRAAGFVATVKLFVRYGEGGRKKRGKRNLAIFHGCVKESAFHQRQNVIFLNVM